MFLQSVFSSGTLNTHPLRCQALSRGLMTTPALRAKQSLILYTVGAWKATVLIATLRRTLFPTSIYRSYIRHASAALDGGITLSPPPCRFLLRMSDKRVRDNW